MRKILLFFIAIFISYGVLVAQEETIYVEAIIESEPFQEGSTTFKAIAVNKSAFDLSIRYKFSVIYSDQGDPPPKENKDGREVLPVVEKIELDTYTLNTNDDERKIVLLLIYDLDDKIIANARVVLNDDKGIKIRDLRDKEKDLSGDRVITSTKKVDREQNDIELEEGDGFVLRGIVLEETKTKLGRDFYQSFFSKYREKSINGERIVKVREAFALGRNTKIEVFVGQDLVWQFFVRPSPDYLKEMEKYAIDRVYKYFVSLRSQKQKKVY